MVNPIGGGAPTQNIQPSDQSSQQSQLNPIPFCSIMYGLADLIQGALVAVTETAPEALSQVIDSASQQAEQLPSGVEKDQEEAFVSREQSNLDTLNSTASGFASMLLHAASGISQTFNESVIDQQT